jgi:flavorubredoxin
MKTEVTEIAERIYRLSTFVPDVTPAGFTFNQFLIDADEPMLFHCGHRAMFPLISGAAAKIVPLEKLRWIGFGHVEADECGSMNQWLAAAPKAQIAHGQIACEVSLNDLADRPPRALADGEVIDLGGRRIRFLYTPHVPHGWEAGVIYEEQTQTLFCGDLFTHAGKPPPMTGGDIVGPALEAEHMFHAMCMGPNTRTEIERLAELKPRTLALMHGSSFTGDCEGALKALAAGLC